MEKYYLCFDIGGTKVKYGILNSNGQILNKASYDTPKESLESFMEPMESIIKGSILSHDIKGISLSCPGFINPYRGSIEVCQVLSFLEDISITDMLREKFNIPVAIENDANCVVLAEKFNGAGEKCDSFAVITIGTGIGGGVFVNGKLIRGHQFKGGEFNFLINNGLEGVDEKFQIYGDNSSTNALIRMYKLYKEIPMTSKVEGYEVFESASTDINVQAIIDKWFQNISYGIINICAMLNPEKILIGGGICEREDFIESIEKTLRSIKWWGYVETKIERCCHKNDGGLIGALYNILNENN